MLKKLIYNLLPPIVTKLITPTTKPVPQRVCASFDDALRNCATNYEDAELCKMVAEKTKVYSSSDIEIDNTSSNIALALALVGKNNLNVLDIGGACGAHYFAAKKILGFDFNWHVVETNKMCEAGTRLESKELKFYSAIPNKDFDIVISSGTIQYMPDPRKALSDLLNIGAKYVLLTRLSLSKGKDIVSIQKSNLSDNGVGKMPSGYTDKIIEYPHTNMSEADFNKIISKDYKVNLRFNETSGIKQVNDLPVTGYGVLLERTI